MKIETAGTLLFVLGAMFLGCKDRDIASRDAATRSPVQVPVDDRGVGPSLMVGLKENKSVSEEMRTRSENRNREESESIRVEKRNLARLKKEDLFKVLSDDRSSFGRVLAAIRLIVEIGGREDVDRLLELQEQYWTKQKQSGMSYMIGRVVGHLGRAISELEVKGMVFDDQVKLLLDPTRREIGHRASMLIFAFHPRKDDQAAIKTLKTAFESTDDIGKIWIIRAVLITGSRFAEDFVRLGLADDSVKVRQSTIHDMALIEEKDLKIICDKLVDYKDADLKTRKLDFDAIRKQWHPARNFFIEFPLDLEAKAPAEK